MKKIAKRGNVYVPAVQLLEAAQDIAQEALALPVGEPTENADNFSCAAKSNPGDCQWPFCGCDPAADRVLESIQEHYMAIVPLGSKLKDDIYQILVETCRGELHAATEAILKRIAGGKS